MAAAGAIGVEGMKYTALAVVCGALCSIVPPFGFSVLAWLVFSIFAAALSVELGIMIFLAVFLCIAFFIRLFPKESLLIPAMVVAWHFNVPFLVPVFAGLYCGPVGIVPVVIGSIFFRIGQNLSALAAIAPREAFEPLGIPDGIIGIYTYVAEAFNANENWFMEIVLLIIGLLIVYIFTKFFVSYGREISIIVACAVMVGGFFIAGGAGDILMLVIGAVISIILGLIIAFFDKALDYPSVRSVQFEDEDAAYFVKIVPKLKD
ncbi:MAG: hypothetical protein IJC39_04545 [Firmicutes bacterium]|nr:hypothetical protein [Bacillota bacterium]